MSVGASWEMDAFWPSEVGKKLAFLPKSTIIKHFAETGNKSMFRDAVFVPDVLSEPIAIFHGLGRAGQDDALCYCGIPSLKHVKENNLSFDDPPPGATFMVFLAHEMEVTKYRFCGCDPDNFGYPIHHATRFGKRLWPT